MKLKLFVILILAFISCNSPAKKMKGNIKVKSKATPIKNTSLIILGIVQDAGSPHIGCKKDCCKNLFLTNDKSREVVSLGIIDPINKKTYLFEATSDLPSQIKRMNSFANFEASESTNGIFLTHAHIGHYSGLMYLGKEGMNADSVPVYAMPRMKEFLEANGPWSQLVEKKNISIHQLNVIQAPVTLSKNLSVLPILVPHRDEYSETVGYIIQGPNKKVLFIPDIDKWEKWSLDIIDLIKQVDYAFIDGTFYDGDEIKSRNITEIPHPFVIESMELFKNLAPKEKGKIHFIHFNHTNPLLDSSSKQSKIVLKNGYNIAAQGQILEL